MKKAKKAKAAEVAETADAADAAQPAEPDASGAGAVDEAAAVEQTDPQETGDQEVTTESIVESLLMSTDVALPASKIARLVGVGDASDVKRHIETLNRRYEETGASVRIQAIAKGYQVLTLSVYDTWVQKLHKARAESRLSRAALETLAIVAYKQPVLRANVEAIRGVAVGDMLVRLREMNLVKIAGRAEEIGRPLLYGTTSKFLDVFGLSSLNDLPKLEEEISSGESFPKLVVPDTDTGEGPSGESGPEKEPEDATAESD
ncbi:MAG: SMC-Scp complex subunit ScpB [Planctomycetes bacterium]|nr:SMC-Scp complex subunit ScpB [Planctomycetota bacterium]